MQSLLVPLFRYHGHSQRHANHQQQAENRNFLAETGITTINELVTARNGCGKEFHVVRWLFHSLTLAHEQ